MTPNQPRRLRSRNAVPAGAASSSISINEIRGHRLPFDDHVCRPAMTNPHDRNLASAPETVDIFHAETKGVISEGARGRDLQTRRAAVPLHSQHRFH
jgi:hypothetical protein